MINPLGLPDFVDIPTLALRVRDVAASMIWSILPHVWPVFDLVLGIEFLFRQVDTASNMAGGLARRGVGGFFQNAGGGFTASGGYSAADEAFNQRQDWLAKVDAARSGLE